MFSELRRVLITVILVLFIGACTQQEQTSSGSGQPTDVEIKKPAQSFKPQDPNFLRGRVPDDALAYMRLPNLFSYASAVKGDAFSAAQSSKAHDKLVGQLRQALQQLAQEEQASITPLVSMWLQHARSPIELIWLANEHQQPIPRVLISTQLGFKTAQQMSALLQQWKKQDPYIYVTDKLAAEGRARVAKGIIAFEIHFDSANGRLRMLAGMDVTAERLDKLFKALPNKSNAAMLSAESSVDASYQGLFCWVNLEALKRVVANTMPPARYAELEARGLDKFNALSLGLGVSEGKGRLRLMADIKANSLNNIVPTGGLNISLQSAGEPNLMFALTLFDDVQLKGFEQKLFEQYNEQQKNAYRKFKQDFKALGGVELETILAALGPEVFFIRDDLGEFSAIRIRNRQAYDAMLKQWTAQEGMQYQANEVRGLKIHNLKMESTWLKKAAEKGKKADLPWLRLLSRSRSHLYWLEEGDYLVLAAVPQLLFDRARYQPKVSIQQWLNNRQRQDTDSSLVLLSSRIKGSPAKLYYTYINLLLFVADIAKTDIDVSALPTAQDIALPESGSFGFQLSSSSERIFAELSYENNPMEFFIGHDMGSVAMLGVLAAIAIPAYQDYVMRARVGDAYLGATYARQWVERHWRQHKRFPGKGEISGLDFDRLASKSLERIELLPDTGMLVLTMRGHARINGKRLVLQPEVTGGRLYWRCRSDLDRKYLPRLCR